MATIFWDVEGIFLIDCFSQKNHNYHAQLLKKLRVAIVENRLRFLTRELLVLHDNPPVYTSPLLHELQFKSLVSDSSSIPHILQMYVAHSNYFLFPNLKKLLKRQNISSEDEIICEVFFLFLQPKIKNGFSKDSTDTRTVETF